MNKLITAIFLILFCCTNLVFAESTHDRKSEKYQKRWNRLIPRQSKLQFAGSMGMFSTGPGWFYGKKDQWETDFYVGFIPRMNGSEGHLTTTLKQTYTPFRLQVNNRFRIEPITAGIYFNKIFGEYFWNRIPERYPKNYYFWAVNTRFHVFLGQAFSFPLSEKMPGRELAFFYEFNTNDLYVISAFNNKTIGLEDIVGLSFGVRFRIF
jgi:hypothetical protein